jgi:hypothetical protein
MAVVRHDLPLSLGPVRAGDIVHITKRRPDLVGKSDRVTYHRVGYVTRVHPYLNEHYRIEMHLSGLWGTLGGVHFGWDEVTYRNAEIDVIGHIPLPIERDPAKYRRDAPYQVWWAFWTQPAEIAHRFRDEVSEFLGKGVCDRLTAMRELCHRDLGGQDAW